MRKENETTLKDALEKLVDSYQLRKKLFEIKVVESWKDLVGEVIQKHTLDIFIKEKTLYIKVDSSVVRQELNFMKKRLVDRINKMLEKNFIDQITVL
jgi:hypothetical protein